MSDVGSNGPRYAGTEKGDAQAEERSCEETRRLEMERGKGHEGIAPPGGYQVAGGKGGAG